MNQEDEVAVRKYDRIIEKVEVFIQHMQNLDFVIDPVYSSIVYGDGEDSKTLSDLLVESITYYEGDRYNPDPRVSIPSAYKCLVQINRAFACGAIKEGEGIVAKLKECSEENVKLKKELEIISTELMRAKERIEEFEMLYPSSGIESV